MKKLYGLVPASLIMLALLSCALGICSDFQDEPNNAGIAFRLFDKATKQFTEINAQQLWETFGFSNLKKLVIDDVMPRNPNRYRPASAYRQVRQIKPRYSLEGDFLVHRLQEARETLQKILKISLNAEQTPRIACSFSGGGYRAMTATAGYMKGLEDLGLLGSVLYCAGLSGSTWFLGPWTLAQDPLANKSLSVASYMETLRKKIRNNAFDFLSTTNVRTYQLSNVARDAIFPKVVFGQTISSIDLYGTVLAHTLLSNSKEQEQRNHLAQQYNNIKTGKSPWPIYTAVSMHNINNAYMYNWYEFNPEEVRNLVLQVAIPAFAFGRKFDKGNSLDFAPEQSFGFLMGIFGSAYATSIDDLQRLFFSDTNTAIINEGEQDILSSVQLAKQGKFSELWNRMRTSFSLDAIRQTLVIKIVDALATSSIGKKRAAPAQVFNPFKGFVSEHQWLDKREQLTFIDAGISYNIPLLPLFRPERGIDIIIIGDASSDIATAGELKKALNDVKKVYGIEYAVDQALSDNMLKVYRPDEAHPSAPIIEYFTFLADRALLQKGLKDPALKSIIDRNTLLSFDAQQCLDKEFCSTFNFKYTENDFNQLSGICEFNIKVHKDIHLQLVRERIKIEEEYGFGW